MKYDDIKKTLVQLQDDDNYAVPAKWTSCKYSHIKKIRLGPRGDLGEEFIQQLLTKSGYEITETHTRIGEHDTKIDKKKFEIKLATEDVHGGYQFDLIRKDYDYEFLLVFGIGPENLWFNVYRKKDVESEEEGDYILEGCKPSKLPGHLTNYRTVDAGLDKKLTKKTDQLRDISELIPVLTALGVKQQSQNPLYDPDALWKKIISDDAMSDHPRFQTPSIWLNSKFLPIYLAENTQTGSMGEKLVEKICKNLCFNAKNESYTGEYDIEINNKKIEIKTATLSQSNVFQFNNIRKDYDYDFLLLLGISPTDIHFNVYKHGDVASEREGDYILPGCEPSVYMGKLSDMSKNNEGADNKKKSLHPKKLRKLTSKEFKNVLSALGI